MDNEIESAFIGSIITDNSGWVEAREIISAEDFSSNILASIFNIIDDLNGKCDIVVIGKICRDKKLPISQKYLTDMLVLATQGHAVEYANMIALESKKRKAKKLGQELANIKDDDDIDEILSRHEGQIINLAIEKHEGFIPIKDMLYEFLDRQVMLKNLGREIEGISTGIRKLDLVSNGLRPGELVIIAARPSMGKTSLALCIADHLAVNEKLKVALFSLESPRIQMIERLISSRALIMGERLSVGNIGNEEHGRMMSAIDEYSDKSIYINDKSPMGILGIRAGIRKLMNKGILPDIVFVDYLQLIKPDKRAYGETRAMQVGSCAQSLKDLAKEMKRPVVCLAQLNRNNIDKPTLADIRESGEVENIADQVWLLNREEQLKKEDCEESKSGKADVDICKNRNGKTALVEISFQGKYTKFSE